MSIMRQRMRALMLTPEMEELINQLKNTYKKLFTSLDESSIIIVLLRVCVAHMRKPEFRNDVQTKIAELNQHK